MSKTRLIILLALLPLGSASAHDFWIEQAAGGFLVQRGHMDGQRLPLDPKKIVSLRCRDPKGKTVDLLPGTRFESTRATASGTCVVISAFADGGYYSLTPDGEKNLPKNQVPDAVRSWRSKQFAKWVDPRSPQHGQPLGDELEVVPATDLSQVKAGNKATFRILLRGRPVAGAILSIAHKGIGESDDEGHVRVRVREGRLMTVAASLRRPIQSAQADTEVFEASLTFEVPK